MKKNNNKKKIHNEVWRKWKLEEKKQQIRENIIKLKSLSKRSDTGIQYKKWLDYFLDSFPDSDFFNNRQKDIEHSDCEDAACDNLEKYQDIHIDF